MTSRQLIISASARKQIRRIESWWRRERSKAPSAWREELRDAFELLIRHPLAGRAITDSEFANVRRLSLNRTHYFLFYELGETQILIVGLRHQSQDPGLES